MPGRRLLLFGLVAATLFAGETVLPVHAGGVSGVAAAGTSLPVCYSQSAAHRVPGIALTGPRLRGMTVDPKTGQLFVFASGTQAVGGKPNCRAAVLTLDGWNGRVLRVTTLGNTMEIPEGTPMADDPIAHRLFVLSTGNLQLPPIQLPGTNNRLFIVDTRTGRVVSNLALPRGARLGALAVDNATYRAYVSYTFNGATPRNEVAVVAVTRGTIVQTLSTSSMTQAIAVDQTRNRVFLLSSEQIVTLDGSSANQINQIALPAGYYRFNGYGVDERTGRLLMTNMGAAPPHSGNPPNPPSLVFVVDSTSGTLLHTVTEGNGVAAGNLVVDPPAGIALSMNGNTNSTIASIVGTTDGTVRRTVILGLPPGGFDWNAAPVNDPRDGTIFGYTGRGVRAIAPGRWNRSRVINAASLVSPQVLLVDPVTHRGYGLEFAGQATDVRAFCLRPNCR